MSDCSTNAMEPKAMIFDCPNRKICEELGVLVDADCIAYCGLYETHRVERLTKLAQDMHRIIETAERCGSTICEGVSKRLEGRMEALGVERGV